MSTISLLTALANASCGVYGVSVDQTIVFWNRSAERMLGFTSEQVLGRRCYEVVNGCPPGSLTPQCASGCPSIRYLRAGLVPSASKLHLLCASGERKWASVSPMVVAGILKDAPLLVHVIDDGVTAESPGAVTKELRQALIHGGADILSDREQGPPPLEDSSPLTPRELDVLRFMGLGWDTPSIAAELGISRHTVRNHIRNLRQKLGAGTKLEAVITGLRLGLLSFRAPPR